MRHIRDEHEEMMSFTMSSPRLHYWCRGKLQDPNRHKIVFLDTGMSLSNHYLSWYQRFFSDHTLSCSYDRIGEGWSGESSGRTDDVSPAHDAVHVFHVLQEIVRQNRPSVAVPHDIMDGIDDDIVRDSEILSLFDIQLV